MNARALRRSLPRGLRHEEPELLEERGGTGSVGQVLQHLQHVLGTDGQPGADRVRIYPDALELPEELIEMPLVTHVHLHPLGTEPQLQRCGRPGSHFAEPALHNLFRDAGHRQMERWITKKRRPVPGDRPPFEPALRDERDQRTSCRMNSVAAAERTTIVAAVVTSAAGVITNSRRHQGVMTWGTLCGIAAMICAWT